MPESYSPSIAIVIPCFNTEAFIREAIDSALGQNYPSLEVIVVDDGSTDRSVDIIKTFGDRVTLELCEHRGGCHARNRGTAVAKSDFVLYLDSDDYLQGDYLHQLALAVQPDTDMVIGAVAELRDGEMTAPFTFTEHENARLLLRSYLDQFIQTTGILWRRSFLLHHGGWKADLPVFQDVDLTIRMLLNNPNIAYANAENAYAVWRHHASNMRVTSGGSWKKWQARVSVLQWHKDAILALGDEKIPPILALRFYELATPAFAAGNWDVGRIALREARRLGLKHVSYGSKKGDALTAILGLEWKMRLGILSYKLFPRPRPYPYNLTTP
jgi:glycosyltransferase involved in cell wall biosynthesis